MPNTVKMREQYKILDTPEYREWFGEQTPKSQAQIWGRLSKIQDDGYFGEKKDVGDDVWELKWKNGRRLYFAYVPIRQILLLLGGNKNGQSKDIHQAKKILKTHIAFKV